MSSQWKVVIGSSLCLASIPALALGPDQPPNKRSQPPANLRKNLAPTAWADNQPGLSLSGLTAAASTGRTSYLRLLAAGHRAVGAAGSGARSVYQRAFRRSGNSKVLSPSLQVAKISTLLLKARSSAMSGVSSSTKVRTRYVTVTAGESLWSISHRYHVSLLHLERWNHLSTDSLLPIGVRLAVNGRNPKPPRVPVMEAAPRKMKSARKSSRLSSRRKGAQGVVAEGVLGLSIVSYAKEFLGVPYVWGGTSPAGFDCSGFVQFVFAHFGFALQRTSYEQFTEGTPVSRPNLLPGDLVFFNTFGNGASHVGIYVGRGRFVAASGSKVQVMSLGLPYWQRRYLGARHVS